MSDLITVIENGSPDLHALKYNQRIYSPSCRSSGENDNPHQTFCNISVSEISLEDIVDSYLWMRGGFEGRVSRIATISGVTTHNMNRLTATAIVVSKEAIVEKIVKLI